MKISYQEIAIMQLEEWGWAVERYKIYGLPWYLKACLYPIIWFISKEVEKICENLLRKDEE